VVEPDVASEGQEADAPATAVVAAEQPERDGSAVGSTPPGPIAGLPCIDCAHAAVCVIRPALEAWVATLPRPVSVLAAITVVEARLELACAHYLAAVAS